MSACQRRFPAPLAPPRSARWRPPLDHQSKVHTLGRRIAVPAEHLSACLRTAGRLEAGAACAPPRRRSRTPPGRRHSPPSGPSPREATLSNYLSYPHRRGLSTSRGRHSTGNRAGCPEARRSQPRATRCSTAATPTVTSTAACTTALPPSLWPPSRHRFLTFMDRSGEALAEEWQDSHQPQLDSKLAPLYKVTRKPREGGPFERRPGVTLPADSHGVHIYLFSQPLLLLSGGSGSRGFNKGVQLRVPYSVEVSMAG